LVASVGIGVEKVVNNDTNDILDDGQPG
jgi:hypothetical protein